jgi:hypothetical protein
MTELSKQEQDLLHHVEVYGMNPTRAGELLSIPSPHDILKRPHVMAARESMRRTVQVRTQITKQDVIEGMKRAIDQGYELGDPAAQIRGWSEIGKLLNFYEAQKVDIRLTGTIKEIRTNLAQADDDELLRLVGDDVNVIDADFYRLEHKDEANGEPD